MISDVTPVLRMLVPFSLFARTEAESAQLTNDVFGDSHPVASKKEKGQTREGALAQLEQVLGFVRANAALCPEHCAHILMQSVLLLLYRDLAVECNVARAGGMQAPLPGDLHDCVFDFFRDPRKGNWNWTTIFAISGMGMYLVRVMGNAAHYPSVAGRATAIDVLTSLCRADGLLLTMPDVIAAVIGAVDGVLFVSLVNNALPAPVLTAVRPL